MAKRLVDIVLGSVLAVLAVPLVVVLAVVSALLFRSWPFFVQERVGRNGTIFRILKIRTLPTRAPAQADKFVIQQVRLPKIAALLRCTHLDELPQLWLVPTGRMSLVGPRPEMLFLHEQGDREFARLRVSVRPGCTGLWQVSSAATGLIWDTSDYDRFYVENSCLRLDFWILARTAGVMLRCGSVTALADLPEWVLPRATRLRTRQLASTGPMVRGFGGSAAAPSTVRAIGSKTPRPVVSELTSFEEGNAV